MPRHGFCSSCQVSNWSFCISGESLRSIQDSGSLSSVPSPDRNLCFISAWVPGGFRLVGQLGGLLVIPARLRGDSTTAEYSWASLPQDF